MRNYILLFFTRVRNLAYGIFDISNWDESRWG